MTAVALIAVLWLAVLVPQAVKSHNERRREFLDSFQRSLGALDAARPDSSASRQPAAAPSRPRSAAQRRRTVLGLLLASMAVSAVPAVVLGGKTALVVHLAVDNVFLLYLGLLVRWRDARTLARRPVSLHGTVGEPAWNDEDDEPLVVSAPRVRAAFQ